METISNVALLFLAAFIALAIVPATMAFALSVSTLFKKLFDLPNRIYVWWIDRRAMKQSQNWFRQPAQNFSHLSLDNKDFHDSDLPRANFEGAHLHHVNFVHTNLWHANFKNSDLVDADFTDADLQEADLRNANLLNSKLERANLRGAVFNPQTKLPFPHERARKKGMVFVA